MGRLNWYFLFKLLLQTAHTRVDSRYPNWRIFRARFYVHLPWMDLDITPGTRDGGLICTVGPNCNQQYHIPMIIVSTPIRSAFYPSRRAKIIQPIQFNKISYKWGLTSGEQIKRHTALGGMSFPCYARRSARIRHPANK